MQSTLTTLLGVLAFGTVVGAIVTLAVLTWQSRRFWHPRPWRP